MMKKVQMDWQTVLIQIRLLLEVLSDLGLHCLLKLINIMVKQKAEFACSDSKRPKKSQKSYYILL